MGVFVSTNIGIIISRAGRGSTSCNMYSSHIMEIVFLSPENSPTFYSYPCNLHLVAPLAGVLCLQLIHLLHSQLELLVLALLVRMSLILSAVSMTGSCPV